MKQDEEATQNTIQTFERENESLKKNLQVTKQMLYLVMRENKEIKEKLIHVDEARSIRDSNTYFLEDNSYKTNSIGIF